MKEAVGFEELRWLQALAHGSTRNKALPAPIGARLLVRGLLEIKDGSFALTARGRIALAKLG